MRCTPLGLVSLALLAAGAAAVGDEARFGVSALHGESVPLEKSGAGWYLNWTERPAPGVALEFVPMTCAYPDREPVTPEALAELAREVAAHRERYPAGTLWLIGDEIGYRPQHDSRPPERYARDFHACRAALRSVDASFRIATGPVILSQTAAVVSEYEGAPGGLAYLDAVLAAYRRLYDSELPADFVAATAHVASGDGTDLDVFREQIVGLRRFLAERGLQARRVVITEFGAAIGRPGQPELLRFLVGATDFLASARDGAIGCSEDDGRLVQRFAWFTAHPAGLLETFRLLGRSALAVHLAQTSLFDRAGELTPLGRAYAAAVAKSAASPPSQADTSRAARSPER